MNDEFTICNLLFISYSQGATRLTRMKRSRPYIQNKSDNHQDRTKREIRNTIYNYDVRRDLATKQTQKKIQINFPTRLFSFQLL